MSDPNTPRAAQSVPKQMSSRLLTMKFMQRATSTSTHPHSHRAKSTSQPTTPSSEPALKRLKTDHTPDSSAPTTPATEPRVYASRSDIKAALQAKSTFEALARAKRAELGFGHNEYETEWVLNVSVPVLAPHNHEGQTDSEDEEETTGRQTYGGYKRSKKSTTTTSTSTSTPASKTGTLAQRYNFDDFDSDGDDGPSDDWDADDQHDDQGRPQSGKKRKANDLDEVDERAMSALDRVDLSKTGYAKAKGAGSSGGGGGKHWGGGSLGGEKKGSGNGKWQGRGSRGKKLGRKKP